MALRLPQVTRKWQALVSVAAIGVSSATATFRPPPVGDGPGLIALGGLLAAVTAGLVYVAMLKFSTRRQLRAWVAVAAVGVVATVAAHYTYSAMWDSNVATYSDHHYVVGDELTPDGQAWVGKEGMKPPSELLFDAGGVPERIWTAQSIARAKAAMRALYYLAFPLTVVAMMATVQAVHCANLRPRKRVKRPTAAPSTN
jgi:hypothetical protein